MTLVKSMKILISAYACSPYQGSEPGVGWGFVSELAKHHELWVIVEEEKFRDDIERYLIDNPDFGKRVRFYFIRKQRNRLLRKFWPPSYYHYYRRWHEDARDLGRNLNEIVHFDLMHQLTMVGFREPGYLWQIDLPFVWGPVGGLGSFPWRFLPTVGFYGALYYIGYNLYNALQARFMSRPRLAARRAGSALISCTPDNQREALRFWCCDSTVISEVGLPRAPVSKPVVREPAQPMRIIWTGLHLPRKALNLGLSALASQQEQLWELHILGKGPCSAAWQQAAERLGLGARCRFHGWLPRDEALSVMESAHVMLITSLRDLTSTVTVEALAMGLPIVCLDHCGFAHVVDDSCGIKVPVTSPGQTIAALRDALGLLMQDEALRIRLARGALNRAQAFSWENKIAQLNTIYQHRLADADAQQRESA